MRRFSPGYADNVDNGIVTAVSSNGTYGLLKRVVGRDPETGELVRKAGVMSVVREGGEVRPGDAIRVELPAEPFRPLERV